MLLVESPKDNKRDWRIWKWEDKWRPSKLQHYWDRLEFWEESWRLEETCYHSKSREKPSANADMKISQSVLSKKKIIASIKYFKSNNLQLYGVKYFYRIRIGGCPRGVMVKAMDCGIVVREFVLQSRYYVHFRANTLGKSMNPLILPAMG